MFGQSSKCWQYLKVSEETECWIFLGTDFKGKSGVSTLKGKKGGKAMKRKVALHIIRYHNSVGTTASKGIQASQKWLHWITF